MTEEPENNQNHENTMPRKRKVWNNQKCHGSTKMLSSNGGFKTYLSCDNGILTTKSCPKGSIFYFAIQCCVSISEFPCKANCLGERGFFHNGGQQESHDYAYFHYWNTFPIFIQIWHQKNLVENSFEILLRDFYNFINHSWSEESSGDEHILNYM